MKIEYLFLGIFLLVIGGIIASFGYMIVREYQTFLGELSRALSASERQRYQIAILMTTGGVILLLVGLGLTMYGVVATAGEKGIDRLSKQIVEESEREFNLYFKYCPLCFAEDSVKPKFSFGGKDYAVCSECGAKWHLYFGLRGFKWAKLENINIHGKGSEFLNKEYQPEFWQRLALRGRKETKN
jgi:hypothetical protein